MKTEWVYYPETSTKQLAETGFSEPVLRVLANRGIQTVEDVRRYTEPKFESELHDPLTMKELPETVSALAQHIERGSKVLVHGDYDVDGLTATRIYEDTFSALGLQVDHIIPSRDEGYGLNPTSAERIREKKYDLVLTGDCGIRDLEIIAELMKEGIEVVVTDHHQPGDELPKAVQVVNPSREDETYAFTKLCGAGVALKVCQQLIRTLNPDPVLERRLFDLAALGTLADIVLLQGENRAIVQFGLTMMGINKRPGLLALAEKNSLDITKMTSSDVGFNINPYLNAAGRLGDPELAYKLLSAKTLDEAREYAEQLEQVNMKRKQLTKDASQEISSMADTTKPIIFVASEKWPRGIAGLIANKLADEHNKPAIVVEILEDVAIGSARTTPGVNITEALEHCSRSLVVYGGHEQAAGFTVKKDLLEQFRADLEGYVQKAMQDADVVTQRMIDTTLSFDHVHHDLLHELRKLDPFGEGNDEPLFASIGVELVEYKWVGDDQTHLKFSVKDSTGQVQKGIFFQAREFEEILEIGKKLDLAYHVRENKWNGRSFVDLMAVDIKESTNDV